MRARSIIAASGVKDAGGVQPPSQWFEGDKADGDQIDLGPCSDVWGGSTYPASFSVYIQAQWWNYRSGQHHYVWGNDTSNNPGRFLCFKDRYSDNIAVIYRDSGQLRVEAPQPSPESPLLHRIVYRYDGTTNVGTLKVNALEGTNTRDINAGNPVPAKNFTLNGYGVSNELTDLYLSNFAVWYHAITDQEKDDLAAGVADPRELSPDIGVLLDGDVSVYAGSLPNIQALGNSPDFVPYNPNLP